MTSFEASLDSLPLELLENIISFIPDRRSLAFCALVCKSWVPAARATLFSSLSLHNDLRTRSFLNLLDNDTPSSLIHARIKHLELSSSSRKDVGSDSERVITSWASRTPKTHQALRAVFGHLNSLSVRFTSAWVTPEGPDNVWYSTITSLRLEFVNFDDRDEFHRLMKSCPALESLELSSIEVQQARLEEGIELEPGSSLKTLSISYIYDPATLALIAPFCGSLRKLEYDWHCQQYASARSLPGVGAIIRAAQGSLEELSLKTGSWAEGVSFNEGIDALFESHLDITRLPLLRRLALDISTIYLLPILRRLADAHDAKQKALASPFESDDTYIGPLPSITHLYIPPIGYKSSFKSSLPDTHNHNAPSLPTDTLMESNESNVQPAGSAPVFQGLNKNLHEALESLLPIHPVYANLVEIRCDADDLYNAADFAVASSSQFFQSQYYFRMAAKEAEARARANPSSSSSDGGGSNSTGGRSTGGGRGARSQPYSTFVPFTRSDTAIALSEADADAEANSEDFLTPTQFSVGSITMHRYPRPGTMSHSRLRNHIRKLRKHMPVCAAKGIAPVPVVRYWFNDVPTGLVAEERMWAAGDGYAGGAGNWETAGGGGGAGLGVGGLGGGDGGDGDAVGAGQGDDEDAENIGGMQGLSMKGMEIWDSEKGTVVLGLVVLAGILWWL
ncbi:hypothetical protein GYMLUDRAFT_64120 [Collybiopsis luxurians FD-317 M1]|uniref:F-box domain-containing protein n=1 Tax=Collybiopsis luxurians FD-317 M1 TaxID=944289 RepID=A0A0D0C4B1_9AGAR|nr:hypothetical protein GYMLUDRAFT_64120 [Collybiopsis luxurians FD-317 M1]